MHTRVLTRSDLHNGLERVHYYSYAGVDAFDTAMLRLAKVLATDGYTCLRPPGAAGALLYTANIAYDLTVLGCAEQPVGSSCKAIGSCEMENGHCVRTIHAEVNAIVYAARHGIKTEGSVIYSLLKPCYQCTKVIIAAGIDKIFYAGAAYNEERTNKLLEIAGVEAVHIDINLEYGHVN